MKVYKDFITKKDPELVDSLDSLEEKDIASKSLIYEEGIPVVNMELLKEKRYSHGAKSEIINHNPQFNKNNISKNISLRGPRITIPKVYVPEIKVIVPNIYKRKKEQNKI